MLDSHQDLLPPQAYSIWVEVRIWGRECWRDVPDLISEGQEVVIEVQTVRRSAEQLGEVVV